MYSRWIVLASYTLVAGASQMLWLNFAPLIGDVQRRYGVGELAASTLVLVFPLLYVLASLPAGALIDRRGYARPVAWAAMAQAAFALLRCDDRFATLLVAQLGIALAQPFIINGITKLVAERFDEPERGLATGIGTMGMFVGMALGMMTTVPLVIATSLRTAMLVFGGGALFAGLAFAIVARDRPAAAVPTTPTPWRHLLRRDLVIVFALSFLGLGYFNGLTTWLEQIVAPNGLSAVQAGVVGGVLIVGGIFGAIVVPALAGRAGRRKPFVLVCACVALLTTYPLCTMRSYPVVLLLGAVLGFFFLPAYALLLETCAELAGAEATGRATGVLMLAGNAGGVLVIVAMPLIKGDAPRYTSGVLLLCGTLVLLLALATRATFSRASAPRSA